MLQGRLWQKAMSPTGHGPWRAVRQPALMLSHCATCSAGAAVAGGQDCPPAWVVAGVGATGVAVAVAAAITTTVGTAAGTATWRAMIAATGERLD